MCGIFGYVTRAGQGPEIARLRRLALITQTRGDHAFGLAWLEADGSLQTFKRPGPARAHLDELDRCRHALAVIGHCRWATHGPPADNRNNHPHPAGAGQLVHNGVVTNYAQLVGRHGVRPDSQCDSEVLGLLTARRPGTIGQRAAWAISQAQGSSLLGLWPHPARVLVARRGRPLHFGEDRDGFYLASLPDGLPGGRPQQVSDGCTRVLIYRRGVLRLDDTPLAGGRAPAGAGCG